MRYVHWMKLHSARISMLSAVFIFTVCRSGTVSAESQSLGEILERQMWADMKNADWAAVEQKIADNFLSTHWFGIQDREQELVLIKGLKIGAYELTDIKTSESPDLITVAYYISVEESINNKRSKYKPYPRLSVWKKNNTAWQWAAHANLNPREEANILIKPKTPHEQFAGSPYLYN